MNHTIPTALAQSIGAVAHTPPQTVHGPLGATVRLQGDRT